MKDDTHRHIAPEDLRARDGETTVEDVLEGRGSAEDELRAELGVVTLRRHVERTAWRLNNALKSLAFWREKGPQQERGRRTAAARRSKREARDRAIADFARRAAAESDELAENPKHLRTWVVNHWRPEWGKPVRPGTVYRILSAEGVLKDLRRSDE